VKNYRIYRESDGKLRVVWDVLFVAPDEFERVRQCLNSPQTPSAAAIRGAEFLRRLPTPTPTSSRLLSGAS